MRATRPVLGFPWALGAVGCTTWAFQRCVEVVVRHVAGLSKAAMRHLSWCSHTTLVLITGARRRHWCGFCGNLTRWRASKAFSMLFRVHLRAVMGQTLRLR